MQSLASREDLEKAILEHLPKILDRRSIFVKERTLTYEEAIEIIRRDRRLMNMLIGILLGLASMELKSSGQDVNKDLLYGKAIEILRDLGETETDHQNSSLDKIYRSIITGYAVDVVEKRSRGDKLTSWDLFNLIAIWQLRLIDEQPLREKIEEILIAELRRRIHD